MITHELTQGSREWSAHRATHFNASDAPVMMGESPHKNRSTLLRELHTGTAADVDPATQRRFDDGHRYEALARPLAEQIIGHDLYPVVGSKGKLSASFDGLTLDGSIGFEHKTLNNDLRSVMTPNCVGADLPLHYQIQLEQQCMVSDAEQILFMASEWEGEELVEERHCWYSPNPELAKRIIDGWAQFAKDLAEYEPVEYAEKPVADAIMQLPALAVQIRGEVVLSNLPDFREAATRFIQGIKTDLETDEDFANAEATVKFCEEAEKNLELTKSAALSQTASIDELMRTIDHIRDEMRAKRLALSKLVTAKKAAIKDGIIARGQKAFMAHVDALESEIKPIRLDVSRPDFAGAAKNKRTLASLNDAVDTELANAKIKADALAKSIRDKLAWFEGAAVDHRFLFSDLQQIIGKEADDFQLLVNTRISEHKRVEDEKAEAERERIRKEEETRAQQPAAQPATQPAESWPAPGSFGAARRTAPIARPTTPPTLQLGQIGERLGFSLTADFLATLGIEPAGRERRALLFHETDFDRICLALVHHIEGVREQQLEVA